MATQNNKGESRMNTIPAATLSQYICIYLQEHNTRITNMQLQKLLYILQVEFLKHYGQPIFDDPIDAWSFGPGVTDIYYKYCHFGGSYIWMHNEKKPDLTTVLTPEQLSRVNDLVTKYAPREWPENDTTYDDLFDKNSLWSRIHAAYIEEIASQKEENPYYKPDPRYNPRMTLDDIKQSILEIGCYPAIKPKKAETRSVAVSTSPLVQQMLGILTASQFDYKRMGIRPYCTVFGWTEIIDPNYEINVRVMSQKENEPLEIIISLDLAGKPVNSTKTTTLTGDYTLRNKTLTVNVTIN